MPPDPRKIILDRLATMGKSKYWLVEKMGGSPSRNLIYSYLRGTTDISGENLMKLLDALGIEIRVPVR